MVNVTCKPGQPHERFELYPLVQFDVFLDVKLFTLATSGGLKASCQANLANQASQSGHGASNKKAGQHMEH